MLGGAITKASPLGGTRVTVFLLNETEGSPASPGALRPAEPPCSRRRMSEIDDGKMGLG